MNTKILDWLFERAEPVPFSGCWIWTRGLDTGGYAQGWFDKGPFGHRNIYEAVRGPIPSGLQLDHKCRIRACVNPDHLEPVTRKTNILRGESFTAVNSRKDRCKRGHEFTPDNTYSAGGRGRGVQGMPAHAPSKLSG